MPPTDDQLHELIHACYEAALDPERWAGFLVRLRETVGPEGYKEIVGDGRSGRSHWGARIALFVGSEGGARHWAIVASLVATAKLNGVEPLTWVTDVLERMVSGRTRAPELARLLPWSWKARRLAAPADV